MSFDHLDAETRLHLAKMSRQQAAKRPAVLTAIPFERWPKAISSGLLLPPAQVWESCKFLAQLFGEEPFAGIERRRLSACRVILKPDGHWEENIDWEELMQVKRECGFGEWYAIEVYPRDRDIVNVANMRHLWLFAEPLNIGWFSTAPR